MQWRVGLEPLCLAPLWGCLLALKSHNWFGDRPRLLPVWGKGRGMWDFATSTARLGSQPWGKGPRKLLGTKLLRSPACLGPHPASVPPGAAAHTVNTTPFFAGALFFYLQFFRPRVSPTLGSPEPLLWL